MIPRACQDYMTNCARYDISVTKGSIRYRNKLTSVNKSRIIIKMYRGKMVLFLTTMLFRNQPVPIRSICRPVIIFRHTNIIKWFRPPRFINFALVGFSLRGPFRTAVNSWWGYVFRNRARRSTMGVIHTRCESGRNSGISGRGNRNIDIVVNLKPPSRQTQLRNFTPR